ncbi:unnamed protein product [Ostreobium quekettii]|uniref:PDZ domain-containing protein n=1 Tax=Ostreobium quekettii TaxID=121088 RepID=A0A8S1ITC5_9CHLO|nr:unnamed protein product [Ostreobium quekettii]|eukprot:evm.model.scf_627.1 EVM.evm.TU.scf_627.1   scf_627:32089-36514(-)
MQPNAARPSLARTRGLPSLPLRPAPGFGAAQRASLAIVPGLGGRCRVTALSDKPRASTKREGPAGPQQQGSTPAASPCDWISSVGSCIGKAVVAAGVAGILAMGQPSAARADDIVRFPASGNPQVFTAQKTLVEAWTIVREGYFDENFGGRDWEGELRKHMTNAYHADNGDRAYSEIGQMLAGLGDPYTRVIPPEEYADFRVSSDGELQGVGLLIALDPESGKLVVLTPIKGGPADRAGVLPGDELLSINGESTQGWDGARAASKMRGTKGSLVTVQLARRTDQIPGVPGIPEPAPEVQFKELKIKRDVVELTPVYATAVKVDDATVGYIKLASLSSKAAEDTSKAINELKGQGVDAFVLDLRNNPGGLVQAGLDVARLWLDGAPTIFEVSGRGTEPTSEVALPLGSAATDRPMAVLVDRGSASASEILAGALHDNHRAVVIGDRTYGKGKIQTVFELQDGSALFLTVAKYQTPAHAVIDAVGIKPDMACAKLAKGTGDAPRAMPNGPELEKDSCFMTAEKQLLKEVHLQQH